MAATRLIAMHQNKGRSLQKCLKDRTDYAQNPEKTEGGELVSSYQCDPEFVEEQFASSKKEYLEITGRKIVGDIIAYQIRQSFKPGEITPEEANKIGYETAMRWTKGKYQFFVCTFQRGFRLGKCPDTTGTGASALCGIACSTDFIHTCIIRFHTVVICIC